MNSTTIGIFKVFAATVIAASTGFWSNSAWAQQPPTQLNSPVQRQIEPGKRPNPIPAAVPVPKPTQDLGSALTACDNAAEDFKPIPLPGAKGEVNLDSCYRGRDHLNCSYNVLLTEAKSLLQNYNLIVQANYPAVGSVHDVCRFTPDTLATDLQNTSEFISRFRNLNAEYNARINCGTKIAQSFKDVVLPDMKQARNILNSMSESIRREMDSVSGVEAQAVEFDKSIEASQRALLLIQKIHRVVCLNHVIPDPSLLVTQERENDRAKDNVAPGFCGYQTIRNADGVWVCRR